MRLERLTRSKKLRAVQDHSVDASPPSEQVMIKTYHSKQEDNVDKSDSCNKFMNKRVEDIERDGLPIVNP